MTNETHTLCDARAADLSARVELQLEKLSISGAIVVERGLGITERLEHRRGFQDHLLDLAVRVGDGREVLQHKLHRFGLARTRVTTR